MTITPDASARRSRAPTVDGASGRWTRALGAAAAHVDPARRGRLDHVRDPQRPRHGRAAATQPARGGLPHPAGGGRDAARRRRLRAPRASRRRGRHVRAPQHAGGGLRSRGARRHPRRSLRAGRREPPTSAAGRSRRPAAVGASTTAERCGSRPPASTSRPKPASSRGRGRPSLPRGSSTPAPSTCRATATRPRSRG